MLRSKLTKTLTTVIAITMVATTPVLAQETVTVDATTEDVERNIETDVSVDGENQEAVNVLAWDGHTADVTTQNINSEDGTGLLIRAEDEDSGAFVEVDGDVNGGGWAGVAAHSVNNAEVSVDVTGSVKGFDNGVQVDATSGSESVAIVEGDVIGYGDRATGLYSYSYAGVEGEASTSAAYVGGDVIGTAEGIDVINNGGNVNIEVEGNVAETDLKSGGSGVFVDTFGDGATDIFVGGDVSGRTGIRTIAEEGSVNNIVVEGTVYGEKIGVRANTYDDGKNNITVWKVETGKDGFIAGKKESGEYVEDKKTEKQIQYIIKVEQTHGATLAATDENGKALATVTATNGNIYEYAHSGDKVLLKVDVADGYNLDAVYGDKGQQYKLVKDAKGDYYIEVPVGGGVYFSAILSKEDDNDNEKEISNKSDGNTWQETHAPGTAQAAIDSIGSTISGGTAQIAITNANLDISIVRTILARRDINVDIACFVNGKLCLIKIPAGADLSSLIEADGSINIEKLAEIFGSVEA